MRQHTQGWRTGASRARLTGERTLVPALPTGTGRRGAPAPAAAWSVAPSPVFDMATGRPWSGVAWSMPLVGLLVYLWSSTTYSIALGEPAMIVALVGLLVMSQPARLPKFLIAFAVLIAWAGIGYFFTRHPALVSQRLDEMLRVWLIALVIANSLRTRQTQRLFMLVFLGGYALYPVRGTIFNYVGGYTVFGRALWNHIYMNPNDLAALTLLMLGLALAFYVREPKGWPRLAAIAGLFLLPVVILLTQSRGTLIALGIVMLIVLAGHRKQLLRTLLVLSAVGIVGYLFAPAAVWERLGGLRGVTDTERLEEVDSSAEQRYEIWKVARTVFADHPVMGVGAGAYPATHLQYTRTGNFKPTAFGAKDAHSTYLTLLAENGVVGLLLFLGIFGATIRWADRVRRRARAVLPRSAQQLFYMELGLIGFFLAGVFASYAHLAFAYVHLALLWCVARSTEEELQALDGTAAFGQRAHV